MNDQATIHDKLNREALLEQLAKHITTCAPPEVIGIHGAWGTGKTSFLYQLQLRLSGMCPQSREWRALADIKKKKGEKPTQGEPNVYVIWFEAWRYQHEPQPVLALLHEMRAQFQWHTRFFQECGKLANVSAHAIVDHLGEFQKAITALDGAINLFSLDIKSIREHGERWERENYAVKLPSNAIREVLNDAIAKLLGKDEQGKPGGTVPKKKRVVVIIDDLDRCDSQMAYRLLEGLKIYLNLDRCLFVLAYDPDALEASVRAHIPGADKYKEDSAKHAQMAVEYLEKICPSPWALPSDYDPADYLRLYLDACPWADTLAEMARRYKLLPLNPRRIKSFVHTLRRFAEHAHPIADAPKITEFFGLLDKQREQWAPPKLPPPSPAQALPALVLVLSYLYHFNRELYRAMEQEEGVYECILGWCEGSEPNKQHQALFKDLERPLPDGTSPAYNETLRLRNFNAQRLVIALGKAPAPAIRCLLLRKNTEDEACPPAP